MSRHYVPLNEAQHFTLGMRMIGHGHKFLGVFSSIRAAKRAARDYFKANGVSDKIIWERNTIGDMHITGYQSEVPDDWDKIDVFTIAGIELDRINLDGWWW